MRRAKALSTALEIRKFEIDLYWRRATYFWAFVGAIFVGYAAVGVGENKSFSVQIILAVLGALFSLAWCLVNHGSKYWQSNWEAHVDLLEDAEIGPLYKRILRQSDNKNAGTFSVSKVNLAVSYMVLSVWGILIARSAFLVLKPTYLNSVVFKLIENHSATIIVALSVLGFLVGAGILFLCCRTQHNHTTIDFEQRKAVER